MATEQHISELGGKRDGGKLIIRADPLPGIRLLRVLMCACPTGDAVCHRAVHVIQLT